VGDVRNVEYGSVKAIALEPVLVNSEDLESALDVLSLGSRSGLPPFEGAFLTHPFSELPIPRHDDFAVEESEEMGALLGRTKTLARH
jgi:hypothetical protein